jgi:hypothetical protein
VDLLQRLKWMHDRLPPWLKAPGVTTSNDHEWQLSSGSRALAFPTTAGDSYTATLAIVDEADLIPDLDGLLRAVKPTTDARGRLLLISRADKSQPESGFKRIYRNAVAGASDWTPIFLPWSARPDRDETWHEKQRKDSIHRTGSEDDLAEQYPETDAEALAPRASDKRLPAEWLNRCYKPAAPLPLGKGTPAIPGLTLFAYPAPGRRYVLGCDPAEGNPGSDDSALCVLDVDTGGEVATLAGKLEPSTFAAHIARVARYYNNAPAMVERNNHGHAVLLWLRDNARGLIRQCGHDAAVGWLSSTKGKSILFDTAGEKLRDADAIIRALETFHQLSSIEGSTQSAPRGQMDDRAIAFVLALQGRSRALAFPQTPAGPGPYGDFGVLELCPGRLDPCLDSGPQPLPFIPGRGRSRTGAVGGMPGFDPDA